MAGKIHNKYIKAALTSLGCTIAAAAVIVPLQITLSDSAEDRLIDKLLSEMPGYLDNEIEERRAQIAEDNSEFQEDFASIKYLMETDGEEKAFKWLASNGKDFPLLLVDKDGTVINSNNSLDIGKKFTDIYNVSPDEQLLLMKGDGYVNTDKRKLEDGSFLKIFAVSYDKGSEGTRLLMPAIFSGKYASVYSLGDMDGIFGTVDERTIIAGIDNATQTFGTMVTDGGDFSGMPISTLNFDESITRAPSSGSVQLENYLVHYRTIQYSTDVLGDITVLAAYTDKNEALEEPLMILLVAIFLLTFLLRLYCFFIDEDPSKLQIRARDLRPLGKKGCTFDTEKARILLPFSLIVIVVVTAIGFYLNSMNMVVYRSSISSWDVNQLAGKLSKVEDALYESIEEDTQGLETFMKMSAHIVESHQAELLKCGDASRLKTVKGRDGNTRVVEICNPWLSGLAIDLAIHDISVFDYEGELVSTSGTQRNLGFSRDDPSSAKVFELIDGVSDYCLYIDGNFLIFAAPFTLHRSNGPTDAVLLTRAMIKESWKNSTIDQISRTLQSASESGHCHYLMTTYGEDRKVVYFPESIWGDAPNLPDAAYFQGYLGFHTVEDVKYLVTTKRICGRKDDYSIISFVPKKDVFRGRGAYAAINSSVMLVIILALLAILLIYSSGKTKRLLADADKEMEERKAMTPIQLEKMNVEIKKQPSASQKILGIMGKIWVVIIFFVFLLLVRGLSSSPLESFPGYLMSFAWQRGLNVFSITTMLIITLSFSFILFLLENLMSVFGSALNAGAETACQLVVSVLRYAGYIAVLFVTLYMFGVDTTGVLASLGAFSVMVGLGAKNLITDILAGISIIMEKDYRVGDIVSISGFCGKVTEIGIRTTKVEDIEGNVKIFYNSSVNGVINMTSRLSAVRMDVKITPEHSFSEVEEKLSKFLTRITNKYPQIKGQCSYLGVTESTPTFNVFRLSIPCDEIDRAPLNRAMIKEFSEFCAEEKINKL